MIRASSVPESRIRVANSSPLRAGTARHVLYWCTSARRVRFNFGLERAADWARELQLPLVILEGLRSGYPWASDRLHRFVLQGMADTARRLAGSGVAYHPYVEPERGHGRGLLEALTAEAAVVVTDHFPTFFLPRMVEAAAAKLDVRLEVVDANGLVPLAATPTAFPTAYAFRRFLHKNLLGHLEQLPLEDPLAAPLPGPAAIPDAVRRRWPAAAPELLAATPAALAALPIDHAVAPSPIVGGAVAGERTLADFLEHGLERYGEHRNRPDDDIASGLSPYLHFGHVSAHEVFLKVMTREGWSPEDVAPPPNGRRAGWWGVGADAEGFLDQLITWRELGFVFCHHRADHDRLSSLPDWALRTLTEHASDEREHLYDLDAFAAASTHDPLWNAAQRQLVREGRMHNYLRMLWGKKILEWTPDPETALAVMIELNNRYALDGRDPNSSSGIFWVLGRHDRPWGPERPVFGTVRYMSSANTARKVPVTEYLRRYGS